MIPSQRAKASQASSVCVCDVQNNCVYETVLSEDVLVRVSAPTAWSAPLVTTLFATIPFPHSVDHFIEYARVQVTVLSKSIATVAVNTFNSVFVSKGSDGPERPQLPILAVVKVQETEVTCVPHSATSLTSRLILIKSTQAEAMKPTSLPYVFPSEYSVYSANAPILSQVCVTSMCDNVVST